MEGPKPNSAYQGHRGACDQCSQRKVRCTPANGACQNCVAWGKTCTYSPKIPAGRPRKKQTTSQKDNAYEATEQNQASARRPAMQPHINRHQSSHELPTLTRSSVSLNSIESQVTTPPNESMSMNPLQDMDAMDALFQHGFCDENSMGDQDYFSSMLLDDNDKLNATYVDQLMTFPQPEGFDRHMAIPEAFPVLKPGPTSNSRSPQRARSSFILPRRQSSDLGAMTFTSLLGTVMDLRSKYDGLRSMTQSFPQLSQTALPDTNTTIDSIVTSFSQFFDDIEPYLTTIHQKFSALPKGGKPQQPLDIQGTIKMIVAGSSIILETAYALHEFLQLLCRSEVKDISCRLKNVLRFSTMDFHVRRCLHSFGVISDIFTLAEGSGIIAVDSSMDDLQGAKRSADALRKELAHAIEEMKTPLF